jgi:hypothetical protein
MWWLSTQWLLSWHVPARLSSTQNKHEQGNCTCGEQDAADALQQWSPRLEFNGSLEVVWHDT